MRKPLTNSVVKFLDTALSTVQVKPSMELKSGRSVRTDRALARIVRYLWSQAHDHAKSVPGSAWLIRRIAASLQAILLSSKRSMLRSERADAAPEIVRSNETNSAAAGNRSSIVGFTTGSRRVHDGFMSGRLCVRAGRVHCQIPDREPIRLGPLHRDGDTHFELIHSSPKPTTQTGDSPQTHRVPPTRP